MIYFRFRNCTFRSLFPSPRIFSVVVRVISPLIISSVCCFALLFLKYNVHRYETSWYSYVTILIMVSCESVRVSFGVSTAITFRCILVRGHNVFEVGWLVVLRINVDLAIFQPYLDLEAGDNQSLKIQVARPGIEPRSSCSASQELNHSATTAPFEVKLWFDTLIHIEYWCININYTSMASYFCNKITLKLNGR